MSAQMKLPANHTALHEDEMMYTTGGAAVDTVARAVVAVGVAAALLVVGGVAARAILSVFGGAGRPDRRHRGQRRRRPELHRRRAGRRPELPEQPDGPVKRPFQTNCRPLLTLLHSVKKVPAGHVVQPGPFWFAWPGAGWPRDFGTEARISGSRLRGRRSFPAGCRRCRCGVAG